MKIKPFLDFENAVRSLRDKFVLRPLARSPHIAKNFPYDFDLAIKILDDHRIAFDPNDKVVGAEIINTGNWLRGDFRKVMSLLAAEGRQTRGKTFLDVGANIGSQTIYALINNDFARAISIEPHPRNLLALRTNALINGLTDRMTVIPKAAAAAGGKMLLSIDPANSGAHSLHADLSALRKNHAEIEVTTIDTILQDLSIDASDVGLVWMDVEGFEPEALEGAAGITTAKVPLYVEINPFNSETTRRAVLAGLATAGYNKAYAVGHPDLPDREFSIAAIPSEYLSGDFLFL